MSIHYCVIARDNDMIVFENLINKDLNKSFKSQVKGILEEHDNVPESSRTDYETTPAQGSFKIVTFFQVIYFVCVVDSSYSDQKAMKFLTDLKNEFAKIYKGNLSFIKKQTNLTPNCYDNMSKSNFQKVIENYNTGISTKNIQLAF